MITGSPDLAPEPGFCPTPPWSPQVSYPNHPIPLGDERPRSDFVMSVGAGSGNEETDTRTKHERKDEWIPGRTLRRVGSERRRAGEALTEEMVFLLTRASWQAVLCPGRRPQRQRPAEAASPGRGPAGGRAGGGARTWRQGTRRQVAPRREGGRGPAPPGRGEGHNSLGKLGSSPLPPGAEGDLIGKKSGGGKILPQTQSPGKGIPERFPKGPLPGLGDGLRVGAGRGRRGSLRSTRVPKAQRAGGGGQADPSWRPPLTPSARLGSSSDAVGRGVVAFVGSLDPRGLRLFS